MSDTISSKFLNTLKSESNQKAKTSADKNHFEPICDAEMHKDFPEFALYTELMGSMRILIETVFNNPSFQKADPAIKSHLEKMHKIEWDFEVGSSTVTDSFFNYWSLFDARIDGSHETMGSIASDLMKQLSQEKNIGILPPLRDDLFPNSRMGIYVHLGNENGMHHFQELFTNKPIQASSPSPYGGRLGELWFIRALPTYKDELSHVIMTTPYILQAPEEEWNSFLSRSCSNSTEYHDFMKYGPTSTYWLEFLSRADAKYDSEGECFFLNGLPHSSL